MISIILVRLGVCFPKPATTKPAQVLPDFSVASCFREISDRLLGVRPFAARGSVVEIFPVARRVAQL